MMTIPDDVTQWTVLIVEDDQDNMDVAQQVLTFQGVEVLAAEDGRQGLEILESITPTMILLDLSMPVMDGWEMLKHVRANPRIASLPIIALTAHAMHEDRDRALEAGFDGYITKPFAIATFLGKIKECLNGMVSHDQEQA